MRVVIVGPGRAGGSLALAARVAGHDVVGVLSRHDEFVEHHGFVGVSWGSPIPAAELMLIAVRDDAIGSVADRLAAHTSRVEAAVHLSGFASVALLDPLARTGLKTGSFHPLQTLPDAETGWRSLAGAWVAVTADGSLTTRLHNLAVDMGMRPFPLEDALKPVYHAGAAAASNFLVTALGLASDLFAAAGVPFDAARPLAEQIVSNSFRLGASRALTGPVARGDWSTVHGHLSAAGQVGSEVGERFRLLTEATVLQAGRSLPIPPAS